MSDPKLAWLKETFKFVAPAGSGRHDTPARAPGNGAAAPAEATAEGETYSSDLAQLGARTSGEAPNGGAGDGEKYSDDIAQMSARVGGDAAGAGDTDDESYSADLAPLTAGAAAPASSGGASAEAYTQSIPPASARAGTPAPRGGAADDDADVDEDHPGEEFRDPPAPPETLDRDEAAAFKSMAELVDATNGILARRRALEAKQPGIAAELRSIAETWETISNDVLDAQAAGTKFNKMTLEAMKAIGDAVATTAQSLQPPSEMPPAAPKSIRDVGSGGQAEGVLKAFKTAVAALNDLAQTQSEIDDNAQRLGVVLGGIDHRNIPRLKQMQEKCARALQPGWSQALPVGDIKGAAQSKKRPGPELWDDDAEAQGVEQDARQPFASEPPPAEAPPSEAEQADQRDKDQADFKQFIDQAHSTEIKDLREQRTTLIEQWQERLGRGDRDKPLTAKWVDEMIAHAEALLPEKEKREADDARQARQQERDAFAALKQKTPKEKVATADQLKKIVLEMNKLFERYQKLKAGREQRRTELSGGAQRVVLALRQAAQKRAQSNGAKPAEIPAEIVATLARVEATYRKLGAGLFPLVDAADPDLAPGLLGLLNQRHKLGLSSEETADAAAIARQLPPLLPNGDSPDRETKDWRSIVVEHGEHCLAAPAGADPIHALFDKYDVADNPALEKQRQRIGQILRSGLLDDFNVPVNVLTALGAAK